MLSNNLNTNEIKDSAGTEVEFTRLKFSPDGSSTEFAKIGESYAYPHRLRIAHTESGTGVNRRRRSVIGFSLTAVGQVNTTSSMKGTVQITSDLPVGNMTDQALAKMLIANLLAFVANTGGNTTIQFDCTGNGAQALLTAGL
jgi:hypothetical protein